MQISLKVLHKAIQWFLIWMVKHCQSSQNSKFAGSLQYLKKEVGDEVHFLHADKVPMKLISSLWASKFPAKGWSLLMGMIKHSQSIQSYRLAVSSQYLKKKVGWSSFFHVDKDQSFCKLALWFLMEMIRRVQSAENRKLVIFYHWCDTMHTQFC